MSAEPVACVGFAHPDRHARMRERHSAMVVNLIATAALTVSLAIAAVAVSIGIARADFPRFNGVDLAMRSPQAGPHVDYSGLDRSRRHNLPRA